MRLTTKQYYELAEHLKTMAFAEKIDAWPGEISKQASAILEFDVSPDQVRRAADMVGVEIFRAEEKKEKKSNPPTSVDRVYYEEIVCKLERMESKLNRLLNIWSTSDE